jgi:glycosyltransferase involved in cell wall biosynthesis
LAEGRIVQSFGCKAQKSCRKKESHKQVQSLRILTFTSIFPNGVDPTYGVFIYQRVAHLAKRPGNEVVVISPIPYFPRWVKVKRWKNPTEVPSHENVDGLTVFHPRYFLLPKVFMPFHAISMFLGCLGRACKLNWQKRIDCIDAHFAYPDGLAGVLLGKVLKVPVVVSARGTDINVYPSFRLIRLLIKWTLLQAGGVIAVSEALKQSMAALGVAKENIKVIPNGVDVSRFYPVSSVEARQRLGLPCGVPIIVSVGALVDAKRHDLLIRAVEKLAENHPGLQVWILGEGPLRATIEKLVKELRLQGCIHLPGKKPNEELVSWFNAADMSCLTSAREGWPNVVTESLSCGTPVVATRVGGIPEILHTTELGVVVEQSVESVVEGIERALTKKWDREAIARQTHVRTWEKVAAEVEEVLGTRIRS